MIEGSIPDVRGIRNVLGHQPPATPSGDARHVALQVSSALTRREREVLLLIVHRRTDREIAEQLCISHRTASSHVANILAKFNVRSRRDAAFAALSLGLVV